MSLCYHRTAKRHAKEWKHSKGNTFVDHAENIVKLMHMVYSKVISTMKSKRSKRAKTLLNGRENSKTIPTDLIIEILSRLTMKSVARFRCLSKLWTSIIDLPYLTEFFTTRASAHPQLLFVYKEKHKLVFLSSPQPQNLDENSAPEAVKHLSRIIRKIILR
ncbi:hypothetical protein F2Q70_00020512 [Brassica cretica]|uniref:F-box domain-containing protein n=1 Tax=Brassica cretica TaxID=69181 RepID=A0A8S9GM62_BRACR|nr:hypothetical protein F2Q70_00020512 [Brassica cretica]KAF2557648.1 hypothetical protein F2Q68_00014032 [Brassica cretica]